MKLNIVSSNVRGLNDKDKKRIVKNQLLDWKADIVCLQETKLEGDCQDHINQIKGGRWTRFATLEANGTRRRIIMMWDSRVWKSEVIIMMWDNRVWKGEVLHIGAYSLTCKFEALLQKFSCHITGVFAPNGKVERRLIWDEKGVVRGLLKGPSAICGDFGVCGLQLEKRNCNKRSSAMQEFTNFI
ncbi:hypothetical protein MTR67_012927 [Solanum verrucosum]|uniref:Endonuclease/exonuclease/phosphatase domain-containing protein n=1 Tax=Solanum verrucosum TaxID=315347 RepID=A0AAF0Q9L5_SOLVR|nr:hypothetical protein MTR67_012927 [Solanum verrucosum]